MINHRIKSWFNKPLVYPQCSWSSILIEIFVFYFNVVAARVVTDDILRVLLLFVIHIANLEIFNLWQSYNSWSGLPGLWALGS